MYMPVTVPVRNILIENSNGKPWRLPLRFLAGFGVMMDVRNEIMGGNPSNCYDAESKRQSKSQHVHFWTHYFSPPMRISMLTASIKRVKQIPSPAVKIPPENLLKTKGVTTKPTRKAWNDVLRTSIISLHTLCVVFFDTLLSKISSLSGSFMLFSRSIDILRAQHAIFMPTPMLRYYNYEASGPSATSAATAALLGEITGLPARGFAAGGGSGGG